MIIPPAASQTVVTTNDAVHKRMESKTRVRSCMKRSSSRSPDLFVSFTSDVDVKEMPHLKDMPAEEVSAVWYNSADFEKIKKNLVTTLRLMIANKPVGSDMCTRGIEFRTPQGAKFRKKNKLEALTAVWNEQVAQWKENVTDDEAIRRVYLEHSTKCLETAQKFGMHDEKAVEKYLGEALNGDDSSRSWSNSTRSSILPKNDDFIENIQEVVVKQSCVPSAA
ncbi:MAG: hypothetical protein SGILL_006906 [Bacillariaceae sp.]